MTNRNIEDIDKLFQEALNTEKDYLPFLEGDWSKLKERLDRRDKRKRGIFWISRLGSVAALILLFFTIRVLLPEKLNPIIQQAEVHQKDQPFKAEPTPLPVSPKDKKTVGKNDTGYMPLLAQNKPVKQLSPKSQSTVQPIQKKPSENDTARVENLSVIKTTKEKTSTSEEHPASLREIVKTPDQKRTPADEPLFSAGEKPLAKPEQERQLRLLAMSVLAAPDYNGVNNLNNASLGNDFGLLLSVNIVKNWSISTGAVYAKKLYQTTFSNYNPTKNIWTEYYPNSVNADCRVLDIPMNINYAFLKRKNYKISLGTGISSYIMLREDYRFTYAETNSSNPLAYHVVNENKHWLSVLNFQASFEERLNSRLSLSLQPYMKIPLGNIGFAGVKLQSFGMAANLNWNFK